MNIERLTQLRRVVEAAPTDRFDMNHYSRPASWCRTAYCAVGWFAVDNWARKNTEIGVIFNVSLFGTITPIYEGETFGLLGALFSISEDDAANLFMADMAEAHLVSKQTVIANIDRILRGEPALPYASEVAEVVLARSPQPCLCGDD
jgi:hypothetical protein